MVGIDRQDDWRRLCRPNVHDLCMYPCLHEVGRVGWLAWLAVCGWVGVAGWLARRRARVPCDGAVRRAAAWLAGWSGPSGRPSGTVGPPRLIDTYLPTSLARGAIARVDRARRSAAVAGWLWLQAGVAGWLYL